MRAILGVLIVVLSGIGAMMMLAQDDAEPRTFYDALDLSSPAAAVETFTDAFQRGDYVTVIAVLSPEAQDIAGRDIALFNIGALVDEDAFEDPGDILVLDEQEHSSSLMIFLLESIMRNAEEADAFLIDLRGAVEIIETTTDENADGQPIAEVTTEVEGVGTVLFLLETSISDRWRVRTVALPGADPEDVIWAVNQDD